MKWWVLMIVLGLCAGGIVYLHRRVGPPCRPNSPAEDALSRRFPKLQYHAASRQELLEKLQADCGVRFSLKWGPEDSWPSKEMRFFEAYDQSLERILRRIDLKPEPEMEARFRPDGSTIHIGVLPAERPIRRVHDVSELVERICAGRPESQKRCTEELSVLAWQASWSISERMRSRVRRAPPFQVASVGGRMIVWDTPRRHRLIELEFARLRRAKDQPIDQALLDVLDRPGPYIEAGPMTLEEHVARSIDGNLQYFIDWDSLARVNMTPETKVAGRRGFATLAEQLRIVLHIEGGRIVPLGCGFVDERLRFAAAEDFVPVIRRYSLAFLKRGPDGQVPTARDIWNFEYALENRREHHIPELSTVFPKVLRLEDHLVAIGSEWEHAALRKWLRAQQRQAWHLPELE